MSSAKNRSCLAILLAAGEGTRMRSSRPKVLHEVGGRPLVLHALAAMMDAGADRFAVVIGPDREDVAKAVLTLAPETQIFVQRDRLGTAHAVLAARAALEHGQDDVLIGFADTPLIRPETFAALRAGLAKGAGVVALGFHAADPTGYGRLVEKGGALQAITEHKDATDDERKITLCNAGLMAIDGAKALGILTAIGNANAQKEYYLTDAVAVGRAQGMSAMAVTAPESEVQGVNDRVQLAAAEAVFQSRKRQAAMVSGVTLQAPETVYFSHDTQLARDVVVEPNVVFGIGVTVDEGAVIHAFSHLESAHVGSKATVGPFARLRPGADLAEKAKIGNFVEIKAAKIGKGAKVSHLTYIGDAEIGADANIGAGTITCNYDGYFKYKTIIGEGAFVGSNSSLVAPVTIGSGAYVGSGSVVTKDVAPGALAVARGRQIEKAGWGTHFNATSAAKKAALKK
ncbi:MAG: bifunctional UDP-N-acetylglucosamine diphosphorylase/glucosamine-1-phosphate N-acetyltransferase GlmU [Bosea sp. (in: a-proteobacteria)]